MEDILLAITVSAFFVFVFFAVRHIGRFIADHFRPYPDMKITAAGRAMNANALYGDPFALTDSFPGPDTGSGKTLPPIL